MGGNVRSRAILITRTLSGSQDPQEYDTEVERKIPAAIEAKAAAAEVAQAARNERQQARIEFLRNVSER